MSTTATAPHAAMRERYAELLRLQLTVLNEMERRIHMISEIRDQLAPSANPSIRAGARVKLKRNVAPAKNEAFWKKRIGTVERIQGNGQVVVRWDDRVTLDFWPTRALDVVVKDAPELAPA